MMQAETLLAVGADQICCPLDDEIIVLHIVTGTYYGLKDVAAAVWKLLQERPRTFAEICAQITREYDVDDTRCQTDLRELVAQLTTAGLIELQPAPAVKS